MSTHSLDIPVRGMTCAGCVSRVERAIKAVPGVADASVNLATERAHVEFSGHGEPQAVVAAIRGLGYRADLPDVGAHRHSGHDHGAETEAERAKDIRALKRDTVIAAAATLPLLAVEMGGHLSPGVHHAVTSALGETGWRVASFVLAGLVLFWPGLRFFRIGVPNLLRGAPEMNSLVAMGAGAAFAYSTAVTFAPELFPAAARHVYFEAAAVIATLILVGRLIEAQARGRTGAAIRRLMTLQPRTARVVREAGEQDVGIDDLRAGDLIAVRPGERVAVDGQVVEGRSFIDESMITGEPVPVEKAPGAPVTGGTLNTTGAFRFRAEKVGSDTVLAQIIRMVEQAQAGKLPVQALVDKVTGWFVPAVIAAAILTFGTWLVFGPEPALTFALVNAVAVLIIACPCAMGLATPTSIMAGTGRAAELGVLFRRGAALQALRDVKVVAFDKTGTLTAGRPALTDLLPADGFEAGEALALAAAVEARSEHPIARAILEAAEERGLKRLEAEGFDAVVGAGARARVGGRRVDIGGERFMRDLGVDLGALLEAGKAWADQARTPLYLAVDGRPAAALAVADPIKPTAGQALESLRAQGLKIAMLTGDNAATAHAVAGRLGLDEVVAEILPAGKVEALEDLRRRYGAVAFVGDGVNDAPALAAADVGVAMGAGTDVAIESAEVVLMRDDPQAVATAVALSRSVMRNIAQNLGWAFGYNILLIPLAAGALYPVFGIALSPVFAAGAMALSSVSVVGNALRLRAFKPPIGSAA
ncbi:MAG: heavy metal translocating P-type ATPase [Phenylobacterium sp.]|uniref:heavy metal translocating P-type ATPase n=1 Tax=Phenylobacterium sp. TaxID=1871053 RepID=UPI00391AB9CA